MNAKMEADKENQSNLEESSKCTRLSLSLSNDLFNISIDNSELNLGSYEKLYLSKSTIGGPYK